MTHVLIVGASLAGFRGAAELRAKGFDGAITLVGDEPHLPYDRPPLSKAVLSGAKPVESTALRSNPPVGDLDLTFRLGETATGLDQAANTVTLEGGEAIGFDKLLIATGARPNQLPFGDDLDGVFTLRTRADCEAIHAALTLGSPKVVVVGAGFIGAEVAATARTMGLDVTVVEPLSVPLERALGIEIGSICADLHRSNGVDLRLGVGVSDFTGSERVEQVVLSDGTTLAADVVIVGVGVKPNVEWLAGSGLTIENGIVCDATCLAAPSITAAGDVARWPNQRFGGPPMRLEHWDNAVQMGQAAARRLLVDDAEAEPFTPVPWFWSDQYTTKIQLAGLTTGADATHTFGSIADGKFGRLYGRQGQLIGCLGWGWPRETVRFQMMIEDGATYAEAVAAAPTD